MALRIGFAYNEKPSEDGEPPSSSSPGAASHACPERSRGDQYAEWDDPATIEAIESALARAGEVIRLEAIADFPEKLRRSEPDVVFNVAEGLHGPNREAHVPAICEFYGIPYTGSDPLALSLGLDKRRAKEVFVSRGVPTPTFGVAGPGQRHAWEHVGLPAIVKPLYEGSSKGIPEHAVCRTREAVEQRVAEVALEYGQPAIVERFLTGREFTCAILGNGAGARALPLVEIRLDALPAGAAPIYGYEAKWIWDTPEQPLPIFECPAPVDGPLARSLESAALAAFHALGCREWARVDLRLDDGGGPQVLEINPLPGILPNPEQNSCFPKAARAAGLSYDELVLAVLDLALERHGLRR